jgi:hypothetical protein
MPSIKEIQRKLSEFNRAAQRADSAEAYSAAWKRIFHKDLSTAAAKSFAQYYREMRSKRSSQHRRKTMRKQRGGDSSPAPVNYQTVPGLLTNTYGQFPVEVDTDPASLDALSGGVYPPNMSIPLSKPGFWPTVPADMGSNKVGGARRYTKTQRRGSRRQKQRGGRITSIRQIPTDTRVYKYVEEENAIYALTVDGRDEQFVIFREIGVVPTSNVLNTPEFDTQLSELKARHPDAMTVENLGGGGKRATRRRRTQRGGNLLDSLAMRPLPYIATPYPNVAQAAANSLSGSTTVIPAPPSPVNYTWELKGAPGTPINPGVVTPITSDFSRLASPAPWQTTN